MKTTRQASDKQEKRIQKQYGLKQVVNSGARPFDKGDNGDEYILVDAKTLMKPQKSQTIEKAWMDKIEEEAFAMGKELSALVIDFGQSKDYFVISGKVFQQLYDAWRREMEQCD